MKKLFDLIGSSVLSAIDGRNIGTICDVVIKKDSLLKIEGFLLEAESDKAAQKFIHWYDIRFGVDFVICSMRNELKEVDTSKFHKDLMLKDDLLDLRVFTNDGKEIGLLKDMYLSDNEGLVEGLQCSDGLIKDILKGRAIIPLFGKIEIGKEHILIGKESLEEAINRKDLQIL